MTVQIQTPKTLASSYEDPAKAHFVRGHRLRGDNAYLMDIDQPPGSYGTPGSAELTLVAPQLSGIRLRKCWGDVRFNGIAPFPSLWLVPPQTATDLAIETPNAIRTLSIRGDFLSAMRSDVTQRIDFDRLHRHPMVNPTLAMLMGALWEASSPHGDYGPLFVDHVLQAMLIELTAQSDKRIEPVKGGLAPWQVKRVTETLAETSDEIVSLRGLADLVGLSPFHFSRMFKRSLGMSPHQYQRQLRLERARQLLQSHQATVTDIALQVGYGSSQAFARAFRESYVISPTTYRRHRFS